MILTALTLTSLFLTIIFGFQYRMTKQPLARKMGQAIMNMLMGTTLILFSIHQFLLEWNAIRGVVALTLLALGLFNFIMGYKNYKYYKENFQ